jgi:hypothetical protein
MILDARGEPVQSRRGFLQSCLRGGLYTAGAAIGLAALTSGGCGETPEIVPTDPRGRLYYDRRNDILDTMKKMDPGASAINQTILRAADKFARSLQPDYLRFQVAPGKVEPLKTRQEKKTLGVIEIFCVDSQGVKMLESYLTDFMISCIMANPILGENFKVAERYRLNNILDESDLRKLPDFDPREAIKRNLFKGIDCILTGNLYPSKREFEPDGKGGQVVSYRGGIEFLMRGIDVTEADIVGSGPEHIDWSPAVREWVDREIRRR